MRLLALVGSLRSGSFNVALARAAAELAPAGVEVELFDGLELVPPYHQDVDEPGREPPPAVQDLRAKIESADALLVVTPEYNGSIPGVLKNAIDWASARHRGSSFRNKTVAIAGASTGAFGAIWAQQDLRRVLGIAGARVIEGEVPRSEEHTSELQSHSDLVCRLLLEKKKKLVVNTSSRPPSSIPAAPLIT